MSDAKRSSGPVAVLHELARHSTGAATAAVAATASATGTPVARQLGPYVLNLAHAEEHCLVYDAYEPSRPQRRLRAKAYIKVRVDPQRISNTIKIQESLKRTCERLRVMTRRDVTSPGTAAPGTALHNEALTDEQLLFLSHCGDHLLLLENKMQSGSKFFLVREHMPDTIYNVLQHGRLQEEGAFYYFFQLLQAVQFLHECDIRHRNICSEHLYLSASGTVLKLGGMGSCLRDGGGGRPPSLHTPTCGGRGSSASEYSAAAQGGAAAATRGSAASPQPGSYGICSHCHRDIPIVTELHASATPTSPTAGSAPLNALYTTCRHCGVAQNRLQVLVSAVGTPSYLAPEVLTYQRPPSLMCTTPNANGTPPLAKSGGGDGQSYDTWAAEYPITEGQAIDMWACGVVLYHMLTATLPFDPARRRGDALLPPTPEERNEMCSRIVAIDYRVPPYVSSTARQLLERMFVRNPMSRPRAIDLMALPCFDRVRASLIPARR
ncbi:hypothetical protein STCU_10203 [Strigomonas culicis]|uniref:Protein kinase domain-containing protein n=1 Tax=Strigomonas culicis TaxID=28005 RepID=S9TJ65_9TRYP|nr:hypothetical protein STCU_10203 [Strigomonas culicis]|eukprot:EPY18087.1 hypothetical protein STCU_10203 [Strigomonas culicis]